MLELLLLLFELELFELDEELFEDEPVPPLPPEPSKVVTVVVQAAMKAAGANQAKMRIDMSGTAGKQRAAS